MPAIPSERVLAALAAKRTEWRPGLESFDHYLQGTQPLAFMTPALKAEFGDKMTALVLNWPELVCDANVDRLDIEGFRVEGKAEADDELWGVWQENGMDARSVLAHADAVGLGKAAVIVGPGQAEDDAPLISVESCLDVSWLRDPRTGRVSVAEKAWDDEEGVQWRTVYTTEGRVTLRKGDEGWVQDSAEDYSVDGNPLPTVPLVPLVNRPRTKHLDGRSELASITPVADAANKIATDMMQSAEYHAMPRRWIAGMKAEDFKDPRTGALLSPFKALKNHIWTTANPDAKFGQFDESSLSNFHDTIRLLALLTAQLSGLPSDYMAFTTVNPPSSDSMKAAETRFIKRIERKHAYFGESWEDVMRLVLAFQGRFTPESARMETIWRSPATPTRSQMADASVKLFMARDSSGRSVVPLEQTRIDLGYSPQERDAMAEMDAAALQADPIVNLARPMTGEPGAQVAG